MCAHGAIPERNKTKCSTPTAEAIKQQERELFKERGLEAKPFGVVATLWLSGGNTRTTMNTSPYVPLLVFATQKQVCCILTEYDDCLRVFKEPGIGTFGDWLEYYNNLDVSPFLEALKP